MQMAGAQINISSREKKWVLTNLDSELRVMWLPPKSYDYYLKTILVNL